MNQPQADQAADSKAASDKPLIIDKHQSTGGNLVIETTASKAIEVTYASRWQHDGNIDVAGSMNGLSIGSIGVAVINGNTTACGKAGSGISLNNSAKLTLDGDLVAKGERNSGIVLGDNSQAVVKGKVAISGNQKASYDGSGTGPGLRLDPGSNWTSEGMLTVDGATAITINHAIFNHHNDLMLGDQVWIDGGVATVNGNVTGKGRIQLTDRAKLTLNGDLESSNSYSSYGNSSGLEIKDISQVSIKSKNKIAVTGKDYGLTVGNLCRFSSEGPMTLWAGGEKFGDIYGGTALLISDAEAFNHQGTMLAEGGKFGISISRSLATISGHTTANSKLMNGIQLSSLGQLILNDALEINAGKIGIDISGKSQLTVGDALAVNAGEIGIDISDKSQLMVPQAATVQTETKTGVQLSNLSSATFKGPTTISSKRAFSIDVGSGASWTSRQQLSLESPFSTALKVAAAQFEHQGSLSIKGNYGVYLESDAVATIRGTGKEVSDITSEGTALTIGNAAFTHQGQLQLTSQGQGMVLSNQGQATIEGRLAITTQMEPAVGLSGGATLDLKQTSTTLNCQQATGSAVQLESSSRWSSSGALAMTTSDERVIQLDAAHFTHQGSLALNEGQTLTIKGDIQTKGLRNVLAITNAGSANLKVDHPLTLNNILLANAGATVILDSPQLSVNGVIDLTKGSGSSLTLNGSGMLQLDTLHCSPGSQLNINGDYRVSIGSVIFDLDSVTDSPAHLAFHLSPKNQLKIGQFVLPKSSTAQAPIIEITGSDLAIDFDLKNVDVTAFPAGRHSHYQAEEQGSPIRLISDASGSLRSPSTAQLTLIPAEGELPVTATIRQLTQALAAEESSEVPGIRQRQLYYYSAAGQSAPIALLTNASSLLIPTSSQLSSTPPV